MFDVRIEPFHHLLLLHPCRRPVDETTLPGWFFYVP